MHLYWVCTMQRALPFIFMWYIFDVLLFIYFDVYFSLLLYDCLFYISFSGCECHVQSILAVWHFHIYCCTQKKNAIWHVHNFWLIIIAVQIEAEKEKGYLLFSQISIHGMTLFMILFYFILFFCSVGLLRFIQIYQSMTTDWTDVFIWSTNARQSIYEY